MLVQPNAAEACFRVKHTREVHIHARNLDAWDQEYEQTSPGVFHGEVRELFDHDLQVFEEVAVNRFYRVIEGEPALEPIDLPRLKLGGSGE